MKRTWIFCMVAMMALVSMGQNVKTSMDKLRDMAAADNGKAQLVLAKHYIDGDSIQADYMMAVHWLSLAYKNGEEKRIKKLWEEMGKKKQKERYAGYLTYMTGITELLLKDNPQLAFTLMEKAMVEGGNRSCCLTMKYVCLGALKDKEEQSINFTREQLEAALNEVIEVSPLVQLGIGLESFVKGDKQKGFALLEKSAAAGFGPAHNELGMYYLICKAPYYDADKAVHHLLEAERAKCLTNFGKLRLCYEKELGGLKKDEARIEELKRQEKNWKDLLHIVLEWMSHQEWFYRP